jgi:hypothetical protein
LKIQNRLRLAIIIFIFLLFSCWTFVNFFYDYKYNKATDLTDDISELRNMLGNNTQAVDKLNKIEESYNFLHSACFSDK